MVIKSDCMKKYQKNFVLLFHGILFSIFLIACCSVKQPPQPLKIAISIAGPGHPNKHYMEWLMKIDSTLVFYNMYTIPLDSALKLLDDCDGLLLTGGDDVHPDWFGQPEDTVKSGPFELRRDTLEFELIKRALLKKMPLLGVCRGEQILNVSQGGSLIADIPQDFAGEVAHRCDDYRRCLHMVYLQEEGTILKTINDVDSGFVTSSHHQAVDRLAQDFKVSATSSDGLTEAIEWKEPEGKSFLIGVQWHPERMETPGPLTTPIASAFIEAAMKYNSGKCESHTDEVTNSE